jgi:hypothetical protein
VSCSLRIPASLGYFVVLRWARPTPVLNELDNLHAVTAKSHASYIRFQIANFSHFSPRVFPKAHKEIP